MKALNIILSKELILLIADFNLPIFHLSPQPILLPIE